MNRLRDKITNYQEEIAQKFISEEAQSHHESFQTRGFFDKRQQQYIPWAPHHDLQIALERYLEQTHPNSLFISIKECDWTDVLDEMRKAEEGYIANGRGPKNLIRKGIRKAGDYTPAINPWLDLVPGDNWMKPLSAGLKLVFIIAQSQADYREKILLAFREFVTILDTTQEKRRLFRTDAKLRSYALDIYEAVLCAITKLVNKLNHRSWKERTTALLLGPLSSKEIDEIVQDVNIKLEKFRNYLDNLRDERLDSVYRNVTSGKAEISAVRLNTKNIEIGVRGIHNGVNSLVAQAQGDRHKVGSIELGVQQINEKIDQLIMNHALDAKTGLYHLLVDTIRAYQSQSLEDHQISIPRYHMLELPQFLETLQVPHLGPTQDLEYVARQSLNFEAKAQMQAQNLTRAPEFQSWLISRKSDLLIVDGNTDGPARISALSAVCATLIIALLKSDNRPIVLHFFCGQHTSTMDSLSGPTGLMRSLITQLLYSARSFNIDFINSRTYRESLERHSLQHLCDAFSKLVEQLTLDRNVFCVIDGISLYETDLWLEELAFVFERLNDITINEHLRPVFKVLFASPYASRQLRHRVARSRHLVLQRGTSNGGLISEMYIGRKAGMVGRHEIQDAVPSDGESSSDDYNWE
ncbi:hypothetical protein N7462_001907 [Penicillium macrosclerotiorum]|uniref:uncharacterized protein n=1 Tax=Penicillium macrosclerotiorum TaxID=303699 RepID=UPI002548F096|nr:uncharacterized protein N7462_001907 [Penicillium macrosclerotiorum]KAJ5692484.1 hypothetical protein N7462_001907 [Penicillium macrosclerotiorum]